jgi:hypothetical protein
MIIVRIFPKYETQGGWNRILNSMDKMSSENCSPLYLSQQEEYHFLSLVYEAENVDSLADIILRNIPSLLKPEKTRTIPLLKPVFFKAPKDRPASLERYQVALRTRPEETENIFNHILSLDYPSDAFPTYAAYSFGEYDILTSMLSTSRNRLTQFVRKNLESQKGVDNVEIGHINRSVRVAPAEMWKKYRESRYIVKSTRPEKFDFLAAGT